MSISIDLARRILETCKQRARELRSPVSIAIVDAGGHLVLFERMMAPYGWATGDISLAKANTSVMFNQSTDAVAQWAAAIPGFSASLASMTSGKFIMAAGGWPIRVNGVTIGGIGVSGGNAPGRDDEIARAGLAVVEGTARPQAAYYQPAPQQPPQSQQYLAGGERPPAVSPVPGGNHNGNASNIPLQEGREYPSRSSEISEQPGTRHLPENESNPYSITFSEESQPTTADQPGEQS